MQAIFSDKTLSTTEKMDKAKKHIKSLPQAEQDNINKDVKEIEENFPNTQAPSDSGPKNNTQERIIKDCSKKAKEEKLQEIRKIVEKNNNSGIPDNMIICQIWHESHFKADLILNAKDSNTAKGLMQMQRGGVRGLFDFRALEKKYQAALLQNPNALRPKYLTPAEEKASWATADVTYENNNIMLDAAQNISMATEYLKYRIREQGGNIEKGLIAYGDGTQAYYDKIKECVELLNKGPNSTAGLK